MELFRVTACWYESVYVEAEDEDDAIEKSLSELLPYIRCNGTVDEYEVRAVSSDV